MKLIISANDGSDGAGRAVAFAAALAKSFDAKLLIVHVSDDKFSQKQVAELEQLKVTEGDALEQISLGILLKAKAIAKDHDAANIDTMTAAGDPAKVLIELAKSKHADEIVVGRRGRGQLEGLLLGSVSQKLASLASCAVTIVP